MLLTGIPLSGCGVPTESEPRPLEPSVHVANPDTPTADTSLPPGAAIEKLYLVRNDQLVGVERRVDRAPALDRQLADLLAGPTEWEQDDGYGSALAGTDFVLGAVLDYGTAVVTVGGTTIRNDEVLAYGQVVCTLAARDDVDQVRFVLDGQPLEVPRADGSLTADPLTAADYAALIAVR
ncbi:GerMN domain-containing protein [Dactylosporangium roseum]|uniref:GerMN domain-containing protein n=1 Tax=Dactylosporangium roseum TaxID=47989 RepID=A0ABY5ZFZ6_9ACTN|nr:GerMN domain-containing protein [Dactylosporangium roseum]UWZ40501.1 GerMN domain-containing protein [Dactylosporangium roseum]